MLGLSLRATNLANRSALLPDSHTTLQPQRASKGRVTFLSIRVWLRPKPEITRVRC